MVHNRSVRRDTISVFVVAVQWNKCSRDPGKGEDREETGGGSDLHLLKGENCAVLRCAVLLCYQPPQQPQHPCPGLACLLLSQLS